jgi:fructoselysine-6-P-deglycase FrlB-like protein
VTDRRAPTSDDLQEWKRDARSDLHKLLDDIRELRQESAALRERIVVVEQFKAWSDRTWDSLAKKVDRHERMIWLAAGAGAATGGGVAAVIKLFGGL